ncbi:hypothetical protein QA634_34060 [Methylobacterium sp. CB376]|uniref:hypothetical protein n=1 Tax=unclassified Methylobacterium TaxID=2615210 RepID=UPI0002E56BD1|nr:MULTISPECIES: hypothetical protein [Methylobacterium]WFT80146.1 hypothetical protein QA634_34060 [Methylobacterium nodulans]
MDFSNDAVGLAAWLPPGLSADGAAVLLAASLLGGLVRGFTGFGFAMVFMPLASVVLGAVKALGLIWFIDLPFALPIAARGQARGVGRDPAAARGGDAVPARRHLATDLA